ncbi:shikimate dehydrogenase [Salipaludibacillus sp. HK11]|uniref:shikimate dehydrogenase n=1 Tax=Salipaludibacillus sp. HK11 TaxID=3394320 RepID=UPI0039FCB8B8
MSKELDFKAEIVGVYGTPISDNPTGVMFEFAFKSLDINWRYLTLEVSEQNLKNAIDAIRALNFKGVNLTIPHKVAAMKYLDRISPDAEVIGAVNTIRHKNGKLIGENTDGKGFLKSLIDNGKVSPKNQNIVVLGAGGAARAITTELALAGAKQITVVNRTVTRGEELVDRLNKYTKTQAVFSHWHPNYAIPSDTTILVQATSIGLYPNIYEYPQINYESLKSSTVVCDVIPNPPNTKFLIKAKKRGCHTLDGLGMLVNQGVIAFEMWTGHEAPRSVMHEALTKVFKV